MERAQVRSGRLRVVPGPSLFAKEDQRVAEIFDRLGTSAETWQARLQKLSEGRLLGRFFAASRERLRDVAARLGLRRAVNLAGCPAPKHPPEVPIADRFRQRVEDSLRRSTAQSPKSSTQGRNLESHPRPADRKRLARSRRPSQPTQLGGKARKLLRAPPATRLLRFCLSSSGLILSAPEINPRAAQFPIATARRLLDESRPRGADCLKAEECIRVRPELRKPLRPSELLLVIRPDARAVRNPAKCRSRRIRTKAACAAAEGRITRRSGFRIIAQLGIDRPPPPSCSAPLAIACA
jgi:hypothetical protein